MIPTAVLDSLSAIPVSQQIRDAAAELAGRLSDGDFDDLDDVQRNDLDWLPLMLSAWAVRIQALEQRVEGIGPPVLAFRMAGARRGLPREAHGILQFSLFASVHAWHYASHFAFDAPPHDPCRRRHPSFGWQGTCLHRSTNAR
jgi:hypothetical protein